MTEPNSILVAVGGSGRGMQAVDTGASLAAALKLPWHAIFIETPRSARDPAIAECAADALAHAAQLGATISREPAIDVAEGLIAHLEAAPARHLVIGAPSKLWRRAPVAGSFLRHLLARRPDLAVHIAPVGEVGRVVRPRTRTPGQTAGPRGYLIGLGLVLATVLLCRVLLTVATGRPLSLLFLFPVIAVAARFGLGPALVAVVASVLSFDLFLLQPLLHLEPLAPVNIILWIALGSVAIYTSFLTGALRSRAALSDRSAQESARIVTFAQTLTRVASWEETAQAVCEEMAMAMDAQALLFREKDGSLVRVAAQPPGLALGPVDQGALDWCWANGEEAGTGTHNVSASDWRFEPLKTSLGMLAVLALSRADGRDPVRADRKVLFATLVGQAALAHERLMLEDGMRSSTAQ